MHHDELSETREIAIRAIEMIGYAATTGELAVTLVRTNENKVLPFLVIVNHETKHIHPVAPIIGHLEEEVNKYLPILNEESEAPQIPVDNGAFAAFMASIGFEEPKESTGQPEAPYHTPDPLPSPLPAASAAVETKPKTAHPPKEAE